MTALQCITSVKGLEYGSGVVSTHTHDFDLGRGLTPQATHVIDMSPDYNHDRVTPARGAAGLAPFAPFACHI